MPYVLSDVERERSRNKEQKRKKRSVSKNNETKEKQAGQETKEGVSPLAGAGAGADTIMTLAHVASNFSVYSLSTDLRAVSMTCVTCALSKEKEIVARDMSEGKNSGYHQRRGSIMTRTVL
jgi:hypothetical protein